MMFEAEQEYSPPFSLWIFWMTPSQSVSYCGLFAIYYLDGQAVTGNYNSFVFVLEHFPILRVAKKDRKKSAKYEKYLLKNDNQLTLWCQVIDRYGGLLLILKKKFLLNQKKKQSKQKVKGWPHCSVDVIFYVMLLKYLR